MCEFRLQETSRKRPRRTRLDLPFVPFQGERDWQKYEKARKLHRIIDTIRDSYQIDWKSKEMRIRQRAVALYFIDKVHR